MEAADACRGAVAGSRQRERRRQHAIGIEPGVGRHESGEAPDEEPRSHQQDAGQRDRGDDQASLQAVPPQTRCRARGLLLKREARAPAIDGDQRDERKKDGRRDGNAAGERQHPEVDRDLLRRREGLGNGCGERADDDLRGQEAEQTAGRGQDGRLYEQKLHQTRATRAERSTHGDFTRARRGPAEDERRDVCARHEEHEADSRQQQQQRPLHPPGDLVSKGRRGQTD